MMEQLILEQENLSTERISSTHKVEVVPIQLESHPNADSLSLVKIFGYQCVVRTEDWLGITKAAYLPPDSLVDPNRPEFSFLQDPKKPKDKIRIKAKRLRGIVSFGLMVPVPLDWEIGEDVANKLGVEHWQPVENNEGFGSTGGEACSAPDVYHVKYDVDAFRRYAKDVFVEREPIWASQKINGSNARYVYHNGELYCGSRTEWKRPFATTDHITVEYLMERGATEEKAKERVANLAKWPKKKNLWWVVSDEIPQIREFCEANSDTILYGEVYGHVGGGYRYNCEPGKPKFLAFDLMKDSKWMDPVPARLLLEKYGVPCVPLLNKRNENEFEPIPYNFDKLVELADTPNLIPGCDKNQISEGIVVQSWQERYHYNLGRVKLKIISTDYSTK